MAMSKVLIYSDPHIGLSRKANSTPLSSALREAWCRNELHALLDRHEVSFCLGDFFDRESNPEETISAGIALAQKTSIILAGNHDIPNREGKLSSLELVREVLPNIPMIADKQENDGFITDVGGTSFFFAPHALTQADYDQMIEGLRVEAAKAPKYRVLCLHCNYDLPEQFLNDSTLNLTKDQALELLRDFHYILIGHVHTPADYFEGRLKLVGSVFPTAFDNLEDKRALVYDTETGTFDQILTWPAVENLLSCPASMLAQTAAGTALAQYFDLQDDLPPGQTQKLAIDLFKAGAFGVRISSTKAVQEEQPSFSAAQFERLPASIERELLEARPHLYELWKEMSHRACQS